MMRFGLTLERIEEMVICIVDNELNRDEAIQYAADFIADCQSEYVEDVICD